MKIFFGKKASQYLFFEMWPGLILGLVVFVLILLMFQALRLTDFFIVHGIGAKTIGEIVFYLCISFLPALFPMALLFAVVFTYGRLSQDSEIVALKALGYSQGELLNPALALSLLVALASAQTTFHLAPWGNRQFEILMNQLGRTKAAATLKEGTFSKGFFDLVIYANEVNSKKGELSKVFIYDEGNASRAPMTIIAKSGKILSENTRNGQSILLLLKDGDIHRKAEAHTKIKFENLDVRLFDAIPFEQREKTPPSLTLEEIQERLRNTPDLSDEDKRTLKTEFHKRWAVSVACVIFGLLGVALGTQTNRRTRSNGLVISLGVIIAYWIFYVVFEGFARSGQLPPMLAIWLPNLAFLIFAFYRLKMIWN